MRIEVWKVAAVAMLAIIWAMLLQSTDSAVSQPSFDRRDEIRFARWDGRAGWSTDEVRKTIWHAVARWPVPACSENGCATSGFAKAIAVASCESGSDLMHPTEPGGYSGTFQQAERYWDGRRAFYNPDAWEKPLPMSSGVPRANVVVSIRQAHANGWSAWEQGDCA